MPKVKLSKLAIIIVCLLIVNISFASNLKAAGGNPNETTSIVKNIMLSLEVQATYWIQLMRSVALNLFKITLALDVALMGISIVLGRTQINDAVTQFISLLIFACFILSTIVYFQDWSGQVVGGLEKLAGGETGTTIIDVSYPLNQVQALVDALINEANNLSGILNFSPLNSFLLLMAAAIIFIVFLIITGLLIIIKAELLVLGPVCMLLIGLGGSKIFKEYAINAMKFIFSIGLKLFVFYIVVNIGLRLMQNLHLEQRIGETNSANNFPILLVAVGASLLILLLTKTLPNSISGILSGSNVNSGNPIASMAKTVAVGAAMAAGGAVQNVAGAFRNAGVDGHKGMDRLMATGSNLMRAYTNSNTAQTGTIRGQLASQYVMSQERNRVAGQSQESSGVNDPSTSESTTRSGGRQPEQNQVPTSSSATEQNQAPTSSSAPEQNQAPTSSPATQQNQAPTSSPAPEQNQAPTTSPATQQGQAPTSSPAPQQRTSQNSGVTSEGSEGVTADKSEKEAINQKPRDTTGGSGSIFDYLFKQPVDMSNGPQNLNIPKNK
jgi:type IV secretion system protein TrbL